MPGKDGHETMQQLTLEEHKLYVLSHPTAANSGLDVHDFYYESRAERVLQ